MTTPHEAEVARGYLLMILDAKRTSDRGRDEDPSTYTAEEVLQLQLRKMGLPMLLTQIRAELYYLYDKELVRFHKTSVGGQHFFSWRITADGVDVLQGHRSIPGIAGV